jgi:hypothetical protein
VLYNQNPLYRRLRKLLFQHSARFSSGSSLLTKSYGVIPLLTLDRIVSSGTIPYKDNVTPLRRLPERIKKSAFATPFLLDRNFANPILHESAHVVISSLDPYRGVTRSTDGFLEAAIQILAEEAFATATELLACAFVQDYEHGLYLAFNSYNADNVVRVDGAKMLIGELGVTAAFVLCCTAYFSLLVGLKKISRRDVDRVCGVLGMRMTGSSWLKVCPIIQDNVIMNERFLAITVPSSIALKIPGIPQKIDEGIAANVQAV